MKKLSLLLFLAATVFAQDPQSAGFVLKTTTTEVAIDVWARSVKKNAIVTDLQVPDLELFENGVPQTIKVLQQGQRKALDLEIVLDASGSMGGVASLVKASAMRFIQSARPEDRIGIISFDDLATKVADRVSPVRSGLIAPVLARALGRYTPGGGTAIYDAVSAAMRELEKSHSVRRKTVVLLTDGDDNESKIDKYAFFEAVKNSNVVIHVIDFSESSESPGYPISKRIALLSGGQFVHVSGDKQIGLGFDQMLDRIGQSYLLVYTPTNPNRLQPGTTRWVRIDSKRPGIRLEYRDHYYVAPSLTSDFSIGDPLGALPSAGSAAN